MRRDPAREPRTIGWGLTAFDGAVAAFSPDGSRLASGGRDGLLWLWDVATGERVGTFEGHGDSIWSVAFHPDDSRIATGSGDGTVRQGESEPVAITHARRVEGERLAQAAGSGVAALVAELGTDSAVAERLPGDRALAPGKRQAALDELLRLALSGNSSDFRPIRDGAAPDPA